MLDHATGIQQAIRTRAIDDWSPVIRYRLADSEVPCARKSAARTLWLWRRAARNGEVTLTIQ